MTIKFEPMAQVRKDIRLSWYRCPIEPARLKELTRRSDLRGAFQTLRHILLVVITVWREDFRLHRALAADMPEPQILLGARREMRRTWKKQQQDPAYQFDTPLPGSRQEQGKQGDGLESSLGELAPQTLR